MKTKENDGSAASDVVLFELLQQQQLDQHRQHYVHLEELNQSMLHQQMMGQQHLQYQCERFAAMARARLAAGETLDEEEEEALKEQQRKEQALLFSVRSQIHAELLQRQQKESVEMMQRHHEELQQRFQGLASGYAPSSANLIT
jgi:hypothetical protein